MVSWKPAWTDNPRWNEPLARDGKCGKVAGVFLPCELPEGHDGPCSAVALNDLEPEPQAKDEKQTPSRPQVSQVQPPSAPASGSIKIAGIVVAIMLVFLLAYRVQWASGAAPNANIGPGGGDSSNWPPCNSSWWGAYLMDNGILFYCPRGGNHWIQEN